MANNLKKDMPHFWLLSFADSRLQQPMKRLRKQAEQMGVFGDRIRIWSESDLDHDFQVRMADHLVKGSRGFGYWCWKPQVFLQLLRVMPEGDVMLYVDVGCHLNPKGMRRLVEYYDLALEHGIVAFQSRALGAAAVSDYSQHFLPEREWTKMDLLRYFGVEANEDILNSGQCGCGIILIRKSNDTIRFIEKFRDVFFDHFELCDDSPSNAPNLPGFHENRHDQSVFSLLAKMNGVFTLSSSEYALSRSYMPNGADPRFWPAYWWKMNQFPIHARQDLGKYTRKVECPDWLKPLLGSYGRRIASRLYDAAKRLLMESQRLGNQS